MNKSISRVFLLTILLVLLVGIPVLDASDVEDNSTASDTVHTTTGDNANLQSVNAISDNKVSTKANAAGNTHKTMKTAQENKTVNNYTELKSAVNEAGSTDNPSYSIKLSQGTYTQYDTDGRGITWSDGYGFIKNMTINGNHQTIRPNSVSSLIFKVTSKHTLILQNLTISESDMYLKGPGYIINNGTLILDSSNSQIGVDEYLNTQYNTGKVIINNSNITKKIYNNGNITITNTTLNNSIVNNGTLTIINSTILGTISNNGSITLIDTVRDPGSSIDGNGKIIIKNTDNKINTVLRVNPLNTVFNSNTTTVTGTLTTEFNKIIPNAVITVTVNNNTYTNRTNYKGEYSISIPVVYGINNITVTFNGDNSYNKAVPQHVTIHSLNYTTKNVNVTDWTSLNKTITEAGDAGNINEYHITLLNGSYHVSYIDGVGQGHYRPLVINWGKGSSPIRTIVINGNNQVFHMGGINISKGYSMKLSNLNIDDGSTEYIPGAILTVNDKYLLTTEIINQGSLELTSVPLNYTSAEWDTVNNKTAIVNSRVYNLNIANRGNLTLNNYTITNGNPGGTVIFNNCLINGTFGGSGTLIINDNTVIGTNATLSGNPKIITNKTLNITKFISRTFNGTTTLNNISIENSINYGNLTIRNSVIDNKYGEFVNTGNLTIINSRINSYLRNNATGVLTLHNSRLNNTVYNYGTLVIGDDVILGNQTVFAGNGRIITNRTDVINYIASFDGDYILSNLIITASKTNNGNLTLNNCTINNTGYNRLYNNGKLTLNHSVLAQNGIIENKGTLILNHSTVNGIINNNGTLIISDDTVLQSNAVIYNYSNGSIITNKTDILHYLGTYTGNNTFRNVKFTTTKINTGNLTLINSSAVYISNNGGNLTLINSTVNGIGSYYGNIIIINSTISHITGTAVYNLTIINTTVSGNKFKGNGSCIDIKYLNNEKYTDHQTNINIINSKFINNTSINNKAIVKDIHLDGNSNINVIIRNTTFTGSGSESGVYIYSNKNTVIDNCTFINKTSHAFYTSSHNFNGGIIGLDGSQKVLINNTLFKDNKGYAITTAPYRIPDLNITNNNFINSKYTVSSNIILAGNYNKMSRNNKVLVKNNTFVNTGSISARVRYLTVINNTFINSTAASSNGYTDPVTGLFYCNNSAVLANNTYINCNISFREFRINNLGNVSVNDTVNITVSVILENPDQYDKDILNKTGYEFYVNNKLYSTIDTPNITIKITSKTMTIKVKADFTSREATLRLGPEQNLTVIITPGNMRSYIVDGELRNVIEEAKVYFRGNFTNLKQISIITPNIIINGVNASFTNISFSLDNNNITITAMHINNTDTSEYAITSNGMDNNITGNTIITYNHAGKTAAIVNNAYDNNIITNNNIIVYGPALSITYTYMNTVSNTQAILSLGGDNNIIRNNTIRVYNSTNPDSDTYSTVEGITAPGSSNHVLIENNDIYVTGGRFNYGIDSLGSINNTIIKDNKINVTGHRYVDGIQLGNQASNCLITGNNITLNCFNTTGFTADNEALAFGIIVTNMGGSITSNITVANNNLNYSAPISYGMEIYQTSKVTAVNNTFNGNGYYTMGLSLAHSPDAKIINNIMRLEGNSNIEINYIVEEIRPANTGIQVQQDSNNVLIKNNYINIYDIGGNDKTINLDTNKTSLKNITITDNKLRTRTQTGNSTIHKTGVNNLTLRNNTAIKLNTSIKITNATTEYNTNITAVILDEFSHPVTEGHATYTIDNKKYNITISNGTTTMNVSTQPHNITVEYNGNSNYNPSEAKITLTKNQTTTKLDTIITTTNMTGKLGSIITLNATIKDANNKAITSGHVVIKLNNKTEATVNITRDGRIIYNLNLTPERFGKEGYDITYVYGGSNTTNSVRTNTRLNIIPFSPKIELKVNSTDYGDNVVMIVKITNGQSYNALSGNIRFKINGITYKINKETYKVQVTNGTAILSFYASKKFIGNNNITILYSGNGKFDQIKHDFKNILHINNYKKTVIHITPVTAKMGQNTTFTARLTDKNGNPLTKGTVAIKINGKTFGHANITNGTINYTQYLDPSKFSAKNYTITIKFGGKGKYAQATVNTTLTVNKHTSKFTYTTTTALKNSSTKLTLRITDDKNTVKANNGTAGLKINGKTYKVNGKAVTVKPVNGLATFTVNTNGLKSNNNITFTYSGCKEFNGYRQTYNNGLRIRT